MTSLSGSTGDQGIEVVDPCVHSMRARDKCHCGRGERLDAVREFTGHIQQPACTFAFTTPLAKSDKIGD